MNSKMDASNNNATYKVILVGDSGVGKSSLLRRYTESDFNNQEQATVGVDFRMHKCRISDNTTVSLQIWDTAGQERYRSMTKVYFRAADVIILVYDITNVASFENLTYWLELVKEMSKIGIVKYLVGNKLDELESNKGQISREEGLRFARMNNMSFMEVSAKNNVGVEEMFVDCASILAERALRRRSIDMAVRLNGSVNSLNQGGSSNRKSSGDDIGTGKSNCSC